MDSVYEFLMKDVHIKYGDTVVAAVSGGPDSMALLHILYKIKIALDIEVVCAHVNHNTGRAGQMEEQKYVEKFCRNHNIIFESMTIEDYGDDNFENEARTKRYNYFEQIVKECKDNEIWSPDGLFTDDGVKAINNMAIEAGLITEPVDRSALINETFVKKAAGQK